MNNRHKYNRYSPSCAKLRMFKTVH
jgi:hypothetical protein